MIRSEAATASRAPSVKFGIARVEIHRTVEFGVAAEVGRMVHEVSEPVSGGRVRYERKHGVFCDLSGEGNEIRKIILQVRQL